MSFDVRFKARLSVNGKGRYFEWFGQSEALHREFPELVQDDGILAFMSFTDQVKRFMGSSVISDLQDALEISPYTAEQWAEPPHGEEAVAAALRGFKVSLVLVRHKKMLAVQEEKERLRLLQIKNAEEAASRHRKEEERRKISAEEKTQFLLSAVMKKLEELPNAIGLAVASGIERLAADDHKRMIALEREKQKTARAQQRVIESTPPTVTFIQSTNEQIEAAYNGGRVLRRF